MEEKDAKGPKLLRMSPLRHSLSGYPLGEEQNEPAGFTTKDWQGSISQSWRRFQRNCRSPRFRSAPTSPDHTIAEFSCRPVTRLMGSPQETLSATKTNVEEAVRSGFNKLQVGLRRRALSVHDIFRGQAPRMPEPPTFYVPKPKQRPPPSLNPEHYMPPPDYSPMKERKNKGTKTKGVASAIGGAIPKIIPKLLPKKKSRKKERSRSSSPLRSLWGKRDKDRDSSSSHFSFSLSNVMFTKADVHHSRYSPQEMRNLEKVKEEEEPDDSKFSTVPRQRRAKTIHQIKFQRGPGQKPLGFTIVGGSDSPKGVMSVYVKTISPNGQAADFDSVHGGDEILSVNGKHIFGKKHQEVVDIFKQIKAGPVVLQICRSVNCKLRDDLQLSKASEM